MPHRAPREEGPKEGSRLNLTYNIIQRYFIFRGQTRITRSSRLQTANGHGLAATETGNRHTCLM